MPTAVVFSDVSDNQVESSSAVYATAREGTGTLTLGDVTAVHPTNTGQKLADGVYSCYQTFLGFDTSSIAGVIEAVTLELWCTFDLSQTDFTAEARLYDWGVTVEAGDFRPGSALDDLPLLATLPTLGIAVAGYNEFTEVDLVSYINQGGMTQFIVVSDRQRLDNAPTQDEHVDWASADFLSTTQDPKFTIVYNETELPPTDVMFA
jgi:hypothetical protein